MYIHQEIQQNDVPPDSPDEYQNMKEKSYLNRHSIMGSNNPKTPDIVQNRVSIQEFQTVGREDIDQIKPKLYSSAFKE